MKEVSVNNFGLLIAYGVPGFVALWGFSRFSETLQSWLGASTVDAPTVSGFLYVTVGSVAAGITVSTVRWAVIDSIHHHTGIVKPDWNFALLQQNVDAFDVLVEIHYRYYQFYGNMLISLTAAYLAHRIAAGFWTLPFGAWDAGLALLALLFFAGSRDTLRKYYSRTAQMLEIAMRQAPEIPERPDLADDVVDTSDKSSP